MSKRPNLLMIGASKSSTTTLYRLLQRHPDIWLPREKGVYYFTSKNYDEPQSWSTYVNLFASAPGKAPIIGEASNSYTQQPDGGPVARRIRKRLGRPKMIYLIRDPVARAVSHFRHKYLNAGRAYATSFSQAVCTDPLLASVSCYAMQLNCFYDEFDPDSVLVLVSEELHRDPIGTLRSVERYLGISPFNWNARHVPRSNSFDELKQTVGWQRRLGERTFHTVRRLTPPRLRRSLKRIGPAAPDPPPVTGAERVKLFELIANDLKQLLQMLGPRIHMWPSTQQIIADRTPACIRSEKRGTAPNDPPHQ